MMEILLNLNITDFIIIAFILLSVIISFVRGFVREALSLTTWVIAAYGAFTFSPSLANQLSEMIKSGPVRTVVAFAGIFLGVVIVGAIINAIIGRLISYSGLGFFDRILGVLFGTARGILLIALLVLMIKGTSLHERHWWRHSQLIPLFTPLALTMEDLFPKETENFDALMLHEKKNNNPSGDNNENGR